MSSITSGSAPSASNGTPGREYKVALCPNLSSGKRNTIIGAVPSLLGITSHACGTEAWAMLISRMSSPLELNILRMISSCLSSVLYSEDPARQASAAFVMSSFVGPSPPVTMTTSLSFSSSANEFTIVSWSSPIDVIRLTLTPNELSDCEI